MTRATKFRVAWTADFYDASGAPKFNDLGLSALEGHDHIERMVLAEHRPEIGPDQIEGLHGIVVLTPAVTRKTLSAAHELLAVGRFGVGYDAVDVAACTDADVVAFITTGAVDRSVAEATVGWMIALTHHVRAKDMLLRQGRWHERSGYMGSELRDRTLGVVGLGGIARATIALLKPFGLKQFLAYDPLLSPAQAADVGATLVGLDRLMSESDFVSIHCPLSDQTRNLIGARELGMMKPGAYLLNTARGGIVDEDALFDALAGRRIAGAAIDCFVGEPITAAHRFGQLDNVLLAPHCIAWTNELFRDIGIAVCNGMIDLSQGRRPGRGVLNPQVFDKPGFGQKWERLRVR
jgi:phosphoglycerate dehydrogenase-like enzyme